jgi:two-component system, cell cycle response regulator DivK
MEKSWKDKKILIAEDSELNFILLKKNIEPWGASILWAKDGMQLVDIVENNNDIDLVLMDLSMPEMDGYTATELLRKKGFKMPIIAQSSFISESEINRVFEVGCNDYITKPFKREELFEKINSLFVQNIS